MNQLSLKRAMKAQQRREAKKLTGKRWKKLLAMESAAGTSVTGLSIKLGPLQYDDETCSNGGLDWRRVAQVIKTDAQ